MYALVYIKEYQGKQIGDIETIAPSIGPSFLISDGFCKIVPVSDYSYEYPSYVYKYDEDSESVIVDQEKLYDFKMMRLKDFRNSVISATKWVSERHNDEKALGIETTLSEAEYREWLDFWQSLRDLPETEIDIDNLVVGNSPMDRLEKLRSRATSMISKYQSEISDIEDQISTKESELSEYQSKLVEVAANKDSMENILADQQEDFSTSPSEELESDIETSQKYIDKYSAEMDSLQELINEIQLDIDSLQSDKTKKDAMLQKYLVEYQSL